MSKRSLVASETGIKLAKRALERLGMTQSSLAGINGVASWSTINRFFNRKPVERELFIEICGKLNQEWQDIAEPLRLLDKIWLQLQQLGSSTEEMGMVPVTEETLGWSKKLPSRYQKSVSVGSNIRFEVNVEAPGYLLLLQKDTSGNMCCFCPSFFAPDPYLNTGINSFPQESSSATSFEIEGDPGQEELLAVITQEAPSLDWLPEGSDEPLELEENHLAQLLTYVNDRSDCKVLYTGYTITA